MPWSLGTRDATPVSSLRPAVREKPPFSATREKPVLQGRPSIATKIIYICRHIHIYQKKAQMTQPHPPCCLRLWGRVAGSRTPRLSSDGTAQAAEHGPGGGGRACAFALSPFLYSAHMFV